MCPEALTVPDMPRPSQSTTCSGVAAKSTETHRGPGPHPPRWLPQPRAARVPRASSCCTALHRVPRASTFPHIPPEPVASLPLLHTVSCPTVVAGLLPQNVTRRLVGPRHRPGRPEESRVSTWAGGAGVPVLVLPSSPASLSAPAQRARPPGLLEVPSRYRLPSQDSEAACAVSSTGSLSLHGASRYAQRSHSAEAPAALFCGARCSPVTFSGLHPPWPLARPFPQPTRGSWRRDGSLLHPGARQSTRPAAVDTLQVFCEMAPPGKRRHKGRTTCSMAQRGQMSAAAARWVARGAQDYRKPRRFRTAAPALERGGRPLPQGRRGTVTARALQGTPRRWQMQQRQWQEAQRKRGSCAKLCPEPATSRAHLPRVIGRGGSRSSGEAVTQRESKVCDWVGPVL